MVPDLRVKLLDQIGEGPTVPEESPILSGDGLEQFYIEGNVGTTAKAVQSFVLMHLIGLPNSNWMGAIIEPKRESDVRVRPRDSHPGDFRVIRYTYKCD
jgi:hypothetical protein